jgi:hypothetical protein
MRHHACRYPLAQVLVHAQRKLRALCAGRTISARLGQLYSRSSEICRICREEFQALQQLSIAKAYDSWPGRCSIQRSSSRTSLALPLSCRSKNRQDRRTCLWAPARPVVVQVAGSSSEQACRMSPQSLVLKVVKAPKTSGIPKLGLQSLNIARRHLQCHASRFTRVLLATSVASSAWHRCRPSSRAGTLRCLSRAFKQRRGGRMEVAKACDGDLLLLSKRCWRKRCLCDRRRRG